jgi:hypothetical protein
VPTAKATIKKLLSESIFGGADKLVGAIEIQDVEDDYPVQKSRINKHFLAKVEAAAEGLDVAWRRPLWDVIGGWSVSSPISLPLSRSFEARPAFGRLVVADKYLSTLPRDIYVLELKHRYYGTVIAEGSKATLERLARNLTRLQGSRGLVESPDLIGDRFVGEIQYRSDEGLGASRNKVLMTARLVAAAGGAPIQLHSLWWQNSITPPYCGVMLVGDHNREGVMAQRVVDELKGDEAAAIIRGRYWYFLLTCSRSVLNRIVRKLASQSLGESTDKLWTDRTLDTVELPRGTVSYKRTATTFTADILRKAGIRVVLDDPVNSVNMLCVCGLHDSGSGITRLDPYPMATWYDGRYILLRLLPDKMKERLPAGTELDAFIVRAPDTYSYCVVAGERSLVRKAIAAVRRTVTSDLLSAD